FDKTILTYVSSIKKYAAWGSKFLKNEFWHGREKELLPLIKKIGKRLTVMNAWSVPDLKLLVMERFWISGYLRTISARSKKLIMKNVPPINIWGTNGIEPKNINQKRDIDRLLHLNSTHEDHIETGNSDDWTMRPDLMNILNGYYWIQLCLSTSRIGIEDIFCLLILRKPGTQILFCDRFIGRVPERRRGGGGVIDGGDAGARNNYEENKNAISKGVPKWTAEEDVEVVQIMAQRLTRDWDLGLGNFQKFEIFSEVLLLLLCSIISLFVINNNKASRKVRVIHPFSFNVDLVFMDYRNANFLFAPLDDWLLCLKISLIK
ncbi:hypothetical protein MJO29_012000, partial [Puccinia striiformis f. sp. tritici]